MDVDFVERVFVMIDNSLGEMMADDNPSLQVAYYLSLSLNSFSDIKAFSTFIR